MDEMLTKIHGIDERISVKNLVFGTSVLYKLVEQFMAGFKGKWRLLKH